MLISFLFLFDFGRLEVVNEYVFENIFFDDFEPPVFLVKVLREVHRLKFIYFPSFYQIGIIQFTLFYSYDSQTAKPVR